MKQIPTNGTGQTLPHVAENLHAQISPRESMRGARADDSLAVLPAVVSSANPVPLLASPTQPRWGRRRAGAGALPPRSLSFSTPSLIRAHLYLGDIKDAADLNTLKRLGVTHIVNATVEHENCHSGQFQYERVPVRDSTSERLKYHFPRVSTFIENARQSGGVTLVHCQQGISRSASLVIAYLMATEKLTLQQAFHQVKGTRHEIEPNNRFLTELRDLERNLFGALTSRGALTPLDQVEEANEDAASRFIGAVASLAAAAASGQILPVDEAVACATKVHTGALEKTFSTVICQTFEAFGSEAPRDVRARVLLATVLAAVRQRETAHSVLTAAIASLHSGEHWENLLMDVPKAGHFLAELQQALNPAPARSH